MTPTDKPMTVDALMAMVQQLALAHFNPSLAPTTLDEYRRSFRTAIEQYGREQGFESTAQRDVREACCELRDALGNPVISGTGDQTIQGQTIRMAAARLRGAHLPAGTALYAAPQSREPQWRMEGDDMTTDKPMTVDALMALHCEAINEIAPTASSPLNIEALSRVKAVTAKLGAAIEQYGREQREAVQAKLDRVMLEYCPEEMTPDQIAEWAKAQVAATGFDKAALDAALAAGRGSGEILDGRNPNPPECDPRA